MVHHLPGGNCVETVQFGTLATAFGLLATAIRPSVPSLAESRHLLAQNP